jgi:hypothetical protein
LCVGCKAGGGSKERKDKQATERKRAGHGTILAETPKTMEPSQRKNFITNHSFSYI